MASVMTVGRVYVVDHRDLAAVQHILLKYVEGEDVQSITGEVEFFGERQPCVGFRFVNLPSSRVVQEILDEIAAIA